MKNLFLSIIALGCTVVAGAQNEVATAILQHGDEMSYFFGIDALSDAHAAAADGDVITLSSGSFYRVQITKAISIYGAGYEEDATTGTEITKIVKKGYSAFAIGVENETLSNVHIEGVYIDGTLYVAGNDYGNAWGPVENFSISKCYINGHIRVLNNIKNVSITKCVVNGEVSGGKTIYADNLLVANSYINSTVKMFLIEGSGVCVKNCILVEGFYHGSNGNTEAKDYSQFAWFNCVFWVCSEYNYAVGIGSSTHNNICPSLSYCFNSVSGQHVGNIGVARDQIFKDATNVSYSPERTFEINNSETLLGTDNTQIGLLGGDGFSKVPSTPVVKSLTTTQEGQTLKVSYEAEVR